MNPRVLLKGLGLILSLALVGWLFDQSDLGNAINEAWIDSHIRGHGATGMLLFLAMGAIFTAVGLPRQIIAFLAGYAFDLALGTFYGALAALLGCALTFVYARVFGRDLLRAKFGAKLGARVRRFDAFIHEHPFSMTLLIRLLPVGSNVLTNLAAGISRVRATPFLAASFVGFVPQTLVFALVGSGVNVSQGLRIGGAVILFLAAGVLGGYLYHRHRHGLSLDDSVDEALGETPRP